MVAKNPLFINKKVWREFNAIELEKYIDDVFNYYRRVGFPYFPTDVKWRDNEYRKLTNYDYTKCVDIDNKLIKQTMHGLSLCWSYHPHHYSVPCNSMRTVMDTFDDDDLLRAVITKRIRIGDNMSDNGIRKMLKIYSGTQCVSNFRPTAAAAIYHQFCPAGGVVYDMSAGFGGRALGAHLAGVEYYGVDPSVKSYQGVDAMIRDYANGCHVANQGSELTHPTLGDSSVDLAFTSPPYFDCEKYADEPTQSYIKYPTRDAWIDGFMRDTMIECHRVMKPDAKMLINIQNVKSFDTLVERVVHLASQLGFTLIDTWGLQLSSLGGAGFKSEPILIFSK